MRIFITGHRGFIGTNLMYQLNCKDLMRRLDREIDKDRTKKCLESPEEFIWEGYDIQEGKDIRNLYTLDCKIGDFKPDVVIHMAARAGVVKGQTHPEEYISTNILGTQNVVNMCNEHQVKKLIFFSSSSIFASKHEIPVREHEFQNPISLYGITKMAGESIVNTANCETANVRPFTVYGANGRADAVIYKWINEIKRGKPITVYGDLDSYRGYVHVEDLTKTIINLIYHQFKNKHESFNIGGSEKIYLSDIVQIFENKLGPIQKNIIPRPPADIIGQTANIFKAKQELSFNPEPKFLKNVEHILDIEFPNRKPN